MDNTRVFAACMIASLVLIVLLAGALFVRGEKVNSAPGIIDSGKTEEEFCKTIQYNGDKINLVFFADKEKAELYSSELLNFGPFDEYENEFNIFYVDSYKVECGLYKDIATFCYSRDLVKKAALCGADYIIVIDDKPANIRSSAYHKVASINAKHFVPTIIAHEVGGHLFMSFAEEYVYNPAFLPLGQKNCLRENYFYGENDGHLGCSRGDYFRYEPEGVMRTLAKEAVFGKYNEDLIVERLDETTNRVTGRVVEEVQELQNCANENYYLIEFYQDESGIEEVSRSVQYGCIGIEANGFGYSVYSVLDEEGNVIYDGNFNSDFVYTDAPAEEGEPLGEVFEYEGNFVLQIPLNPEAEILEITNSQGTTKINIANAGARACAV